MKIIKIIIVSFLIIISLIYFVKDHLAVFILQKVESERRNEAKLPLPKLNKELKNELVSYLTNNYKTPEEYVIDNFKNHDIVFLGESHRIKHDVEFIHKLIPLLYKNKIFNLGIEFACYRDQKKIDLLITSKEYDEVLAKEILFNFAVFWGYQEYADIFKVAWELNQQIPDTSKKFRVVGLNTYSDWSYVKTTEDRENKEVLKKVMLDGDYDEVMANSIVKEFINKNEKALIYSGSHHAFTKFKQPLYNRKENKFEGFKDDRMGNRIYKLIGNRAFTIRLHAPWFNEKDSVLIYPADGIIDSLMLNINNNLKPVGFDVKGTPFGKLSGSKSVYKHGYDNFILENYCDGYIYQKPLSEYKSVTAIKGFINRNNFSLAMQQFPNPELKKGIFKLFGPVFFDYLFTMDSNIEKRFQRLK